MANDSYAIEQRGDDEQWSEIANRSRKESAIKVADETADEHPGEEFRVVTGAGTVVHEVSVSDDEPEPEDNPDDDQDDDEVEPDTAEPDQEPEAEPVPVGASSNRAKPWSKSDKPKTFTAREFPNYELAYVRERTKTGIYRATDKSGWLIFDHRIEDADYAGETFPNTETARVRTNAMQQEYREQQARLKAEARDERERKAAEAKAEAARKRAEADDAKKERAAAKAEAKKEKEAAASS